MKAILSRKGWDSGFGGASSPILPSREMLSLPIPEAGGIPYADISAVRLGIADVATVSDFLDLYRSREETAHLDPDLDEHAHARCPGWRPCFGQSGGAASHLDAPYGDSEAGVRAGDLFLFYGGFDFVVWNAEKARWSPKHKDRYVIWGWLQVDEILRDPVAQWPPWVHDHPHFMNWEQRGYEHNRIYVARDKLTIEGWAHLSKWPGGGVFRRYHPNRCLTQVPGNRGSYPDSRRLPAQLTVCRPFEPSRTSRHRQEHVQLAGGIPIEWLKRVFV